MKSAEEAPWKARFNLANLQISSGSIYIKTNATQLSGISPSFGFTTPSMSETPPDILAPIDAFEISKHQNQNPNPKKNKENKNPDSGFCFLNLQFEPELVNFLGKLKGQKREENGV